MKPPSLGPRSRDRHHRGRRDHARAMAGTVVDAMPTVPAVGGRPTSRRASTAADVLWDEVVAGGGYTAGRAAPRRPPAADRPRTATPAPGCSCTGPTARPSG